MSAYGRGRVRQARSRAGKGPQCRYARQTHYRDRCSHASGFPTEISRRGPCGLDTCPHSTARPGTRWNRYGESGTAAQKWEKCVRAVFLSAFLLWGKPTGVSDARESVSQCDPFARRNIGGVAATGGEVNGEFRRPAGQCLSRGSRQDSTYHGQTCRGDADRRADSPAKDASVCGTRLLSGNWRLLEFLSV